MQRVNVYDFCELGGHLWLLETITPGSTVLLHWRKILSAQYKLGGVLADRLIPVRISHDNISKLLRVLDKHVPQEPDDIDFSHEFTDAEVGDISASVSQVKTVLNAEYAKVDTYFVEPKGIYSTPDLIERAENALPPRVLSWIGDETKVDLHQAGRCLAFDLPTAAAFHIWRATERVLLKYRLAWVKKPTKSRNWKSYIIDLEKTSANAKVLRVIDQIRDLHRNPTMHPDAFLTVDDAVTLLGIAASVIIAMVSDLPASQSGIDSCEA